MAKVEGLQKVLTALQKRASAARKDGNVSVSVGFTQNYAVYVHENLEAYHKVGQAKFLEQPARELSDDGTLGGIVKQAMAKGSTLAQGLLLAGLRLQRDAQLLTPVDTGALRASAFTRQDK